MRILIFLLLVMLGSSTATAWAAPPAKKPPINNAVPPCDNSVASQKPSCHIDSDSVNVPPRTPDERGVVVPPEVPAEGLPNREKTPGNPVNGDTHDGYLKK